MFRCNWRHKGSCAVSCPSQRGFTGLWGFSWCHNYSCAFGVTRPWHLTVNSGCISHMTEPTRKGIAFLFASFALCGHWSVPTEAFCWWSRWRQVGPRGSFRRERPLFPPAHSTVDWSFNTGQWTRNKTATVEWSLPVHNPGGRVQLFMAVSTCFGGAHWLLTCLQDKGVSAEQEIPNLAWWEMIFLHVRMQYHITWACRVATAGWAGLLPSRLSIPPSHPHGFPGFVSGENSLRTYLGIMTLNLVVKMYQLSIQLSAKTYILLMDLMKPHTCFLYMSEFCF